MTFTDTEKEVIFLKAVNELIDTTVNYEMIRLSEGDGGAQAMFKSSTHIKFFNIILVDFLSKSAEKITGASKTYLMALTDICETPYFVQDNSIASLKDAVAKFSKWLESEIEVDVWLPSIDLGMKLRVLRREFIVICGNISKHNFSRLSRIASDLKNILARNSIVISEEDGLLILDDFYERFHTDIITYHGSHIVEHLNNIRWGVHDYLKPEFERSIVYEQNEPPRYHYTYPQSVTKEFAKNCYWDLMNEIRAAPYVKRFVSYPSLKASY